MLEYLAELDPRLYERYLTVERNIKSGSNSFYDAYLDLQEQFLRFIITQSGLDASTRETCGALLKRNDVKELCIQTIGIGQAAYDKMEDYTLKVNAHKHKGEKKIQLETIINYMRVFYEVLAAYATYRCMGAAAFDPDYYVGIFGIFEKENAILKEEMLKLEEELSSSVEAQKLRESDLEAYKQLLSVAELEKMDLETQNIELLRQISILKDIKLSSMEEKLNQTIDLLLELKPAIVENRIITKAVGNGVGRLINGKEDNVERWIQAENDKKDKT